MNKNLALLSTLLYGVFVIAIVVGIVELIFMALDPNFTVGNDPKVLAGAISQKLVSAAMIVIISPFCACIGAVILAFNAYRARWYFYWLFILSVPYALFFPFGTGVFAFTWAYLIYHRKAFQNQPEVT
jgi:hypothetical protein